MDTYNHELKWDSTNKDEIEAFHRIVRESISQAFVNHIEANAIVISPNLAKALNMPPITDGNSIYCLPDMIMGLHVIQGKQCEMPLNCDFYIIHTDNLPQTEIEALRAENATLKQQLAQLREILNNDER